jgi:hypothetical protein
MKSIYLLVITALIFLAVAQVNAQSAVAFCEKTGVYGLCHGQSDEASAMNCALAQCRKSGGSNCKLAGSYCANVGFGALAQGRNANSAGSIGWTCGHSTKTEAITIALKYCEEAGGQNCQIKANWDDRN